HAFVDYARLLQFVHFADLQMRNHGGRIFGIAHEAGHIAHEHEALGLERDGGLRRPHVGVAVVNARVLAESPWTDHPPDTVPNALAQRLRVDLRHLTDKANVDFRTGILVVVEEQFAAAENVSAGKHARLAAEGVDRFDDLWIDLARQDLLDHVHRRFICDAHTLDELRLQ